MNISNHFLLILNFRTHIRFCGSRHWKGGWGAPHYSLYGGNEVSFIRKRVGGRRISFL